MTNNLLLELFCGTGSISEAFQELGWQTVGVDITDHGYKAGPLLVRDMQDFVTKDFIAKYWRDHKGLEKEWSASLPDQASVKH